MAAQETVVLPPDMLPIGETVFIQSQNKGFYLNHMLGEIIDHVIERGRAKYRIKIVDQYEATYTQRRTGAASIGTKKNILLTTAVPLCSMNHVFKSKLKKYT